MMIYLLKRTSPFVVNVIFTAATIACSVVIVMLLDLLLRGYIDWTDVLIGTLTPLIISWLLTGSFIRLLLRLQRTESKLQALANEDPLTGMLNRRRFLELAQHEWRRSQGHRLPLSLLMIDADHFKAINDTYGHEGGDAALGHLAQIMRGTLRDSDLAGRFGGEEFAILLPGTNSARAAQIAEGIRADIAAAALSFGGSQIMITVSIGVAADTPDCPSLDRLLARADQALYLAKAGGRNRVAGWQIGGGPSDLLSPEGRGAYSQEQNG